MADLSALERAIRAARRGHNEAAGRLLDSVLEAEPENELALTWRARVTDDPGAKSAILQRALAVNPENQWAAGALEAVGDVKAGAAPTSRSLDDVGTRAASIENLQCPNCAGQVEIHPDRGSKSVVCTHCGSVLDLTSKQLEILGRVKPSFKPAHDIYPGAEAVLEGEKHLVIGWMKYKGWDDEESWVWDEWQLVSDSGTARYLSYSRDEGFLLQTPIRPTPKVTRRGAELPEGRVSFHEVGPAKISGMAGELTWRPQLDKTLQVAEGRRGGIHYSAELTADEIEVVGGPKLSELEVWTAFGRNDKVEDLKASQEKWRRRRKAAQSTALLFFLGAALFVFLGSWLAPKMGGTFAEASATYSSEPVSLFGVYELSTEMDLWENDTLEVGRVVLDPDNAYRTHVRVTSPVDPPLGVAVGVAFVGPGGSPVFRPTTRSLFGPEGTEVEMTSSAFTLRDPRYPDPEVEVPDGEYRMVYLVKRYWSNEDYSPVEWTEPVSFSISSEVERIWTPEPFWFAAIFSFFLSLAFFVFSRTGSR